jgi:hypothetical protein
MDSSMFNGFDKVLFWLLIFALLGVALGVWKLIEIIIWVFSHLHWS